MRIADEFVFFSTNSHFVNTSDFLKGEEEEDFLIYFTVQFYKFPKYN